MIVLKLRLKRSQENASPWVKEGGQQARESNKGIEFNFTLTPFIPFIQKVRLIQ
jgi:hypothetical protein